ncbi:MAG: hypothetical protein QM613_04730 [Micrococcaceae bacterium]
MAKIKAYFVQHTHWDREWYFSAEDAKILSDQVFTGVLQELDKNPKVNFCLDGQTSIVDEYLEINPKMLPLLQKLVAKGRLFVGPWYSQTDCLLPDAESILRNLIIGIHDASTKYGKAMMVGYLPDSFGFNAQMPTLLNQVGLDTFMSWRGVDVEDVTSSPYFTWEGLGDKKVTAMNFPFGYMTGMITNEALTDLDTFVKDRLDLAVKFLSENGNNSDILIPSGFDQKSMVIDFDKAISEVNEKSDYEVVVSDYPSYSKILKKQSLPVHQGELRDPVYARVHRTIGSVRTRMKLDNFKLEQYVLRRIEPLMVMAKSLNITIGTGTLDRLWKKMLANQAHDSLGGCVADNVAVDIHQRAREAYEIAKGIENLITKRMADALELTANQVLVVNTDPTKYIGKKLLHVVSHSKNIAFEGSEKSVLVSEKFYPARDGVQRISPAGYDTITEKPYYELSVEIDVEIPAFGYKVIEFTEVARPLATPETKEKQKISNDHYTLAFEDGKVILFGKDGREYEDFIRLTDIGNAGDTYDFSPIGTEIELDFSGAYVRQDDFKQTLIIEGKAELPVGLNDRYARSGNTKEITYSLHLTLDDSETIEGKVHIDNQVFSHRMRLQIRTPDIEGNSIAQIQNGFIANANIPIPENWEKKYVEKPVNIRIFDKSVSIEGKNECLTIFADGIKEYERAEDKLFITLFATTGELGKADLAWRPGRASGDTTNEGHIMMPTPLAQEVGKHEYTFALRASDKTLDQQLVAKTAHARLTPSISYQRQMLNVFINRLDNKIWPLQHKLSVPKEISLLNFSTKALVSAIYPAYFHKNHFVVRLANPTENAVKVPKKLTKIGLLVDALENKKPRISEIPPFDYISVLIDINHL